MRFTVDGTEPLEQRIADDMMRIREAVLDAVGQEAITALILGGGYGRGEGGVYLVDGEERVYNDYDFFVVVPYTSRRRRKELSRRLVAVKKQMEPLCGIHVDFSPPMPMQTLSQLPYELMFMEAKAGHKVIYGPKDIFEKLPNYDTKHPPLEEGARLLMNRGMGLLLSRDRVRQTDPLTQEDHEFVVRNIYKAIMAMGDCVLFHAGDYSPSYLERLKRFQNHPLTGISEAPQLRELYQAAMTFKLRPQHDVPTSIALETWHAETVAIYTQIFLWFERQRFKDKTLTWESYCALPSRLPELSAKDKTKNLYQNFNAHAGCVPKLAEWLLHPRDRILKRLPILFCKNESYSPENSLVLKLWQQYG